MHGRFLIAIAALTAVAAGLRFATLDLQSYHHDEVITAIKVIAPNLRDTLYNVRSYESTPPLYYLLAWGWSHLFGVGAISLRSISALAGVATVPVAALIGLEAAGRRIGIALAALVAVSPMLIWYSQEARAYALLVLLCAVSLLFFLRFQRSRERRDLVWWALASALALATHYFAAFVIAIEAGLLLREPGKRRQVLVAIAPIAAVALALAPLVASQSANLRHTTWIANSTVAYRALETAVAFAIGETGRFIGQKPSLGLAVIPLVLLGIGALLALRAPAEQRRAAGIGLAVGGGALLVVLVLAVAGQDYLLDRNLLPVLIPLGLVAAVGFGATRPALAGTVLASLLVAYWLAFDIYVDTRPNLQRPDWRTAAARLGPVHGSRAIVTWKLSDYSLAYYLNANLLGVTRGTAPQPVSEIDVIYRHPPRRGLPSKLPSSFHQVEESHFGDLTLVRFRSAHPVPLSRRKLAHFRTGFPNNGVFVQGPAATAQLGRTGSVIRGRN